MEQMLNAIHRRLLTFRNDPVKMGKEVKRIKRTHNKKYDKFSKPIVKKYKAYYKFANQAYTVARSLNHPNANIKYEGNSNLVDTATGLEIVMSTTAKTSFIWADNINDKSGIVAFYQSWHISDTSIGRAPWVSIWASTGVCLKIGQKNPCTGKLVTDVEFTFMRLNKQCGVDMTDDETHGYMQDFEDDAANERGDTGYDLSDDEEDDEEDED